MCINWKHTHLFLGGLKENVSKVSQYSSVSVTAVGPINLSNTLFSESCSKLVEAVTPML